MERTSSLAGAVVSCLRLLETVFGNPTKKSSKTTGSTHVVNGCEPREFNLSFSTSEFSPKYHRFEMMLVRFCSLMVSLRRYSQYVALLYFIGGTLFPAIHWASHSEIESAPTSDGTSVSQLSHSVECELCSTLTYSSSDLDRRCTPAYVSLESEQPTHLSESAHPTTYPSSVVPRGPPSVG